jgi:hypothetical protein
MVFASTNRAISSDENDAGMLEKTGDKQRQGGVIAGPGAADLASHHATKLAASYSVARGFFICHLALIMSSEYVRGQATTVLQSRHPHFRTLDPFISCDFGSQG